MHKISLKPALLAGSVVLVVAGSTAPVFAIATIAPEAQATVSTRLDAAKLKLCTVREKVIDNILTRVANRGNRHLTLISGVATKTEAYYISSGKTLGSYDSLVTTVNADKTAAQMAVDQVKTDSTVFKCDGTDPLGTLQTFKDHVKAEVSALQDYKSSVKDLVAGVKNDQA